VRHASGAYEVLVHAGVIATLGATLEQHHAGARPVVIAFGGGVTTDLAGFVAATFLRGVPWIAVPTTTLGMLDAAVGGKTGVDTSAGKNLVGAFHAPSAVLCDPATLRTLPERTFREGLAEAVKHAATLDAAYGDWIRVHATEVLARDLAALQVLIRRSVELKAAIVSGDEREEHRRAILNAGHTVAHGLERASNYAIPHGEAVAIGLVVETRVAERMGISAAGTADRVAVLLDALGLPTAVPAGIDRAAMVAAMGSDKKNRKGVIHAAMIADFGTMAIDGERYSQPFDSSAIELV
jgi:3-dehydroquinate synthase